MIKVIIFDLGNVICPFDRTIICQRLANHCSYTAEQICRFVFDNELFVSYERGEISSNAFYQEFCSKLGLTLTFSAFSSIWQEIFIQDEGVVNLIRKLKVSYRLFLLSNTNELHFNYIYQNVPILEQLEELILSYELRTAKPAAAIYQEAIKRARCAAGCCIYIDDNPEYVRAATKEGLIGIPFQSSKQLEQELTSYGVVIDREESASNETF